MSTYPGADQGSMPDQAPGQAPYQQPVPGQYPGPTQSPPPVAPPARSRGQYVRLGIGLLIVVVIIGGFFLFRDRLSNDAASLQPGECFDQPAAGTTLVTDVQRQPCNEPHDAEVVANVNHTAAPAASYPPASEFDDLAGDECVPLIQSYTGLTIPELIVRKIDFGYFYPTPSGWGDGDRVVTCYAISADNAKLTGTVRASGAPSPTP